MISTLPFLRLLLQLAALLGTSFLLTGCNEAPASSSTAREALPHSHRFPLRIDDKTIQVQLALSQQEMARGLMERTSMPENEGMIFLYPRPIQASFWMKNTPLPLDIGFFSPEGILVEVYRMHPFDETPVQSRSNQISFALEMNQGWFAANRIRPGAFLDLKLLREAVEARGFPPERYGL